MCKAGGSSKSCEWHGVAAVWYQPDRVRFKSQGASFSGVVKRRIVLVRLFQCPANQKLGEEGNASRNSSEKHVGFADKTTTTILLRFRSAVAWSCGASGNDGRRQFDPRLHRALRLHLHPDAHRQPCRFTRGGVFRRWNDRLNIDHLIMIVFVVIFWFLAEH